jgi:uncharacterized membrane protein
MVDASGEAPEDPGDPDWFGKNPSMSNSGNDAPNAGKQQISDLVAGSVESIVSMHAEAEGRVERHQRFIERATIFLGRPGTLYTILGLIVLWIVINIATAHYGRAAIDPAPFSGLQGVVSGVSLIISTIVLITQNRQGRIADRRAHLDLQINLLAEQKITKLISLVEELRRDMPDVDDRNDPVADAMSESADPRVVLAALEERFDDDTEYAP